MKKRLHHKELLRGGLVCHKRPFTNDVGLEFATIRIHCKFTQPLNEDYNQKILIFTLNMKQLIDDDAAVRRRKSDFSLTKLSFIYMGTLTKKIIGTRKSSHN